MNNSNLVMKLFPFYQENSNITEKKLCEIFAHFSFSTAASRDKLHFFTFCVSLQRASLEIFRRSVLAGQLDMILQNS